MPVKLRLSCFLGETDHRSQIDLSASPGPNRKPALELPVCPNCINCCGANATFCEYTKDKELGHSMSLQVGLEVGIGERAWSELLEHPHFTIDVETLVEFGAKRSGNCGVIPE